MFHGEWSLILVRYLFLEGVQRKVGVNCVMIKQLQELFQMLTKKIFLLFLSLLKKLIFLDSSSELLKRNLIYSAHSNIFSSDGIFLRKATEQYALTYVILVLVKGGLSPFMLSLVQMMLLLH